MTRATSVLARAERWEFLVATRHSNVPIYNEEALIRGYFKTKSFSAPDLVNACTSVAYRDFCRTLRGISRLSNKDELPETAQSIINCAIFSLPRDAAELLPSGFEQWHKSLCERIPNVYREGGFPSFTIGQSQKWVNITFKYIFSLGESWIRGLGHVYPMCHAPLDKVLGDALLKFGFPFDSEGWSRISSYEEYLIRQNWIREHFEIVPLDVEFLLWAGEEDKARVYVRDSPAS
jgi:hypothetical protein